MYECKLCKGTLRTEVEVRRRPPTTREESKGAERVQSNVTPETEKGVKNDDTQVRQGKRRKRERFSGLRSAIEKSKAEKTNTTLSLLDLMKPSS